MGLLYLYLYLFLYLYLYLYLTQACTKNSRTIHSIIFGFN